MCQVTLRVLRSDHAALSNIYGVLRLVVPMMPRPAMLSRFETSLACLQVDRKAQQCRRPLCSLLFYIGLHHNSFSPVRCFLAMMIVEAPHEACGHMTYRS